jgi:hypothetical protein
MPSSTNSSISDRFALHAKAAPYRTYVVAFEIARGALPDALYWDTEDPITMSAPGPGLPGPFSQSRQKPTHAGTGCCELRVWSEGRRAMTRIFKRSGGNRVPNPSTLPR